MLVLAAAAMAWHGLGNLLEPLRLTLRFYLDEPGSPHPGWSPRSLVRFAGAALVVTICAHTVRQVIDLENSFALGLWLGCMAAGALLWTVVFISAAVLAFWHWWWWFSTFGRRSRCRRILRSNGWPRISLSPRLLSFDERSWFRLPHYEEFALTPWFSRWNEGKLAPLNLYAALALAEELDRQEEATDAGSDLPAAEERVERVLLSLQRLPSSV